MKYNTVYDNISYNYPQCGGYVVRQSPDKKTVLIDIESNFTGNMTNRRERIVYDNPVDLSDITAYEIENMRYDNRIEIVRAGYEVR